MLCYRILLHVTVQTVKSKTHVRLGNLPICPELTRTKLPRASDVGHFLSLSGTIIRATVVKMLEYARQYICAKCKTSFLLEVGRVMW